MKLKLLGCIAASLILTGCATSSCITIPSNQSNNSNTNLGSGLLGSVSVTPSSSKLAGDMLYAKVGFYNKTSVNQSITYQFQWFGPDGFNQGNPSPWTPLQLLPNMSKVVSSVAPTPETTQFNVNVCYH